MKTLKLLIKSSFFDKINVASAIKDLFDNIEAHKIIEIKIISYIFKINTFNQNVFHCKWALTST